MKTSKSHYNFAATVLATSMMTMSSVALGNTCDDLESEFIQSAHTEYMVPLNKIISEIDKAIKTHGPNTYIMTDSKKGTTEKLGNLKGSLQKARKGATNQIKAESIKQKDSCEVKLGALLWNEDLSEDYGFIGDASNFTEVMSSIVTGPILKLFGASGVNNDINKLAKLAANPVLLFDKTLKEVGRAGKRASKDLKRHQKNVEKAVRNAGRAIEKLFKF